jgi:hypothetical protein
MPGTSASNRESGSEDGIHHTSLSADTAESCGAGTVRDQANASGPAVHSELELLPGRRDVVRGQA